MNKIPRPSIIEADCENCKYCRFNPDQLIDEFDLECTLPDDPTERRVDVRTLNAVREILEPIRNFCMFYLKNPLSKGIVVYV